MLFRMDLSLVCILQQCPYSFSSVLASIPRRVLALADNGWAWGIYVEVMKDVTFRIAPITEDAAEKMIKSIKAYKLLEGLRGEKPPDTASLAECLERLSQIVTELPEIQEIDINPLVVFENGCRALDARILLS